MVKARILVTYKDKHKVINTDIIKSIQTGRAIASEAYAGMLGDDTGDNISVDNSRYCELTAQYWAWKNYSEIESPEYIGFMHYRRHFSFFENNELYKNLKTWLSSGSIYYVDSISSKLCQKNLNDELILKMLDGNQDCFALKSYDINKMFNNDVYIREHFISRIPGAKRLIWDIFYDTLIELYPQDKDLIEDFSFGSRINPCNMFIMKKDLFFRYSEFCFNVLKRVDSQVDYREFNTQEKRFLGYLGEKLLTLFLIKIEKEGKGVKYLDSFFIEDVEDVVKRKKMKKKSKIFAYERSVEGTHDVLTILGIKLRWKTQASNDYLKAQLEKQETYIKFMEAQQRIMMDKITELQEVIILNNEKAQKK